ncbi:MAG: HEAT repeat domain-containing protein [Candidatus Aminicenantes bacterium]|nr:HEAT repeat domain-containing protein [Candidatus Aminicenantes bacterium]
MEKEEKLKTLRKLSEDKLRKKVLIPLFKKMKFSDVIDNHGHLEKGIDILFNTPGPFGEKEYTGVVLKKDNITGSASSPGGAMTVLNQVRQALKAPRTDKYSLKDIVILRCFVFTAGEITSDAIESIQGEINTSLINSPITFFDGNKIVDFLDEHMPKYFFIEIECFNKFFTAMKDDFQTIRDVLAIGQRKGVPLERIYVSLKLVDTKGDRRELPVIDPAEENKIFSPEIIEKKEREKETLRPIERVMDVYKALKDYQKMVVVGAPGAGKTTLLKHLALKYCLENIQKQERVTVPIPVTLREFIHSGKSLREYIDHVFEKYCFPEANDFVEKDLRLGKCLLLLDGFDELATYENQYRASREIERFIKLYPWSGVMVTSRTAGYHDELNGFTRLELMEFDDTQTEQFINNWFGERDLGKAVSMLKAVKENENIKKLARNPLMIAIIAVIYGEDKKLPKKRAALYRRAVDVLLSKWDQRRNIENRFSHEKKEFFLRTIAFENHSLNRRTISEDKLLEKIRQYAPRLGLENDEAGPFLEEIWQRSFLLRQVARGTYDFLHLSFQEYFTALELKEHEDGIGVIISNIDKPWWEEPILLYAGTKSDASPLVRRIREEVKEDIFYSNLMLSGRCAADAVFPAPGLKDELYQELLKIYKRSEFESLWSEAFAILVYLKPEKFIGYLTNKLKDKDRMVVHATTSFLGRTGSKKAIPPLIKILTGNKDDGIRVNAADSLCRIDFEEAIPHLIKALRDDKDGYLRKRISTMLGRSGSEKAIPQLVELLRSDKYSDVRSSAASALGHIGSENAIPQLIHSISSDEDSVVRRSAADALGKIGSEKAISQLIHMLTDAEISDVRYCAAEALGQIGSEKSIQKLIHLITNSKLNDVRCIAAYALGQIGSEEPVPQLLKLTKDKDIYVRSSAAAALGCIGSKEAIPQLHQLTKDNDKHVRYNAAVALGLIGSEESVPHLFQLTNDKIVNVRRKATISLGQIGSTKSVTKIIKILKDEKNNLVREDAAEALGYIGSEEAIPQLINTISIDKERLVCCCAVRALGKIGGENATTQLIKILTINKNDDVRRIAAEVLVQIGSKRAIPQLIKSVSSDKSSSVRSAAAAALGRIGSEESIQTLKKGLTDTGESNIGDLSVISFNALKEISRRLQIRIYKE